MLSELKQLNQDFGICIWFSMQSHRDEPLNQNGHPVQLENYDELFDKAVFLVAQENKTQAIVLKDGDRTDQKFLLIRHIDACPKNKSHGFEFKTS